MNTRSVSAPAAAALLPDDWESLFQTWLPRVYNYFRYRIGDDALAQDLTATTFIKAWRARADYSPDIAAVSTWLFAIARHVAVDHFREQRIVLPLDALHPLAGGDAVEYIIEQQEEVERLNALLAALPTRDREIIALKYGAEMTNRAIAALLGLSESNVGTILHRTVHSLRSKWDPAT